MNKNLLLPCVLLMACGTAPETAKQTVQKIDYPTTRKDSTAGDTLHGVFVADPTAGWKMIPVRRPPLG